MATKTVSNATARTAESPPAGGVPGAPLVGFGLALVALGGFAGVAARGGAGRVLAERPLTAGLAGVLVVQMGLPPAAWAGGGGGATFYRRWHVMDPLGTSVMLLSSDGVVVHRRHFDPFGRMIGETTPPGEPSAQLFTGKRLQPTAGLYDFGARWYDPEAGRFAGIDPLVPDRGDPQSHNPYGYVRNNPMSMHDPDGRDGFALTIGLSGLDFGASIGSLLEARLPGWAWTEFGWGPKTGPPPGVDTSASNALNGGPGGGNPTTSSGPGGGADVTVLAGAWPAAVAVLLVSRCLTALSLSPT